MCHLSRDLDDTEGRAFWANGKDSKVSVCLAYSRNSKIQSGWSRHRESGKTGF